jgi:hypothetical protein
MPTVEELFSIVDFGRSPAIDMGYFPLSGNGGFFYWSSTSASSASARATYFYAGGEYSSAKSFNYSMHLVRGQ